MQQNKQQKEPTDLNTKKIFLTDQTSLEQNSFELNFEKRSNRVSSAAQAPKTKKKAKKIAAKV